MRCEDFNTTMECRYLCFSRNIKFLIIINALDEELQGMMVVIAIIFSKPRKLPTCNKNTTIEMVNSGLITDGMVQSDWANGAFFFYSHFKLAAY